MSIITNEIRDQYLAQATPAQWFLSASPTSGAALWSIAQKYSLTEDSTYTTFAVTVGDIILGFYRIQDTVPLLQQELGLDPHTAALLGADVLEFLAPLSDPNWQPPEGFGPIENEEVVEQNEVAIQPILPNIPTPDTPFDTTRTTPDIAPYVAPVAPPLRTMAADMTHPTEQRGDLVGGLNYEPVYTSSQDNIRRPISDTPSYITPVPPQNKNGASIEEPPRWGG